MRFICMGWDRPRHFSLSAKRRRQNTSYVDNESNYVHLCNDCMKENDQHWSDMWSDYYSGLL